MNRAERRELRRVLGFSVVTRVLTCDRCGDQAVHIEAWEGDDVPRGLPIELGRCDCGGFWLPDPLLPEGGDAR